MADMAKVPHDPFRGCALGRCNHDLARTMTAEELGHDGPLPSGSDMADVLGLSAEEIEGGEEI